MKLCGIYLITHTETGRKYVGQSVNIRRRLLIHASGFRQSWIGKAVLKYGWHAFRTEILELCDRESLNATESKWIAAHECFAPNGFNLTTGGRQQFKVSAATCAKISAAKQNMSAETRAKIGAKSKGRKFSAEVIARRSAKQVGSTHTAETRAKLSRLLKGRVFTDEWRQKISDAQKKRLASPEARAALSKNNAGKVASAETRAKMAKAHTGLKQSLETIAKKIASRRSSKSSRQIPLPLE